MSAQIEVLLFIGDKPIRLLIWEHDVQKILKAITVPEVKP